MALLKRLVPLSVAALSGCVVNIPTDPNAFSVEPGRTSHLRAPAVVSLSNLYSASAPATMRAGKGNTWVVDQKDLTDTAIIMLGRSLEAHGIRVAAPAEKNIRLRITPESAWIHSRAFSPVAHANARLALEAHFGDGTVARIYTHGNSPAGAQRAFDSAVLYALNELLIHEKFVAYMNVAGADPAKPPVGEPAAPAPTVSAAPAPTESAALAPTLAAAAPTGGRFPQVGDTWTYRLTERQRGATRSRNYTARVVSSSEGRISDQVIVDYEKTAERTHAKGRYLVTEAVSILSPYLAVFEDLSPGASVGEVGTREAVDCSGRNFCTVSGMVSGRETVRVPAGTFHTIRVSLKQSWMNPSTPNAPSPARDLIGWYAPDVKRFVKFSSRPTWGDTPDFDLELTSYQLK